MSARDILEQFLSGARQPVAGPLTYPEALGLVSINEQLVGALRSLLAVPAGTTGPLRLAFKLGAHHHASKVLRLATDEGVVLDEQHGAGFHAITAVCGNCHHARKGRGILAKRSCSIYGWPVQASATCRSHAYEPTIAKIIPIRCEA